ncbi:hypothetical protein R69658_06856 [Paraburkholderia aspalathi]|uniref:Abortive infection protein-like C-terminal domain-containing protein n=1 Tax=Paraburkholderia aspalathi TaxID=1324617 RepID=A0ABM8SZA5_9BURK|nr:abortive infection family protein [Paraburkholderia aspalathi]MBK3823205.1 abortive infection family protein [Paraburkholderia aspalathi]MBK3835036.1 abortive infection family protein [Paraburkholderia aspalathi]MBK3864792.1 abortive infection family protein [Paraburkholderia aspalathi]CAE6844007.1 hypothetical protein R69658_06856 [Paraburkholderia aspalathi]
MDDKIKALGAQKKRIEAKQAELAERARTLEAELGRAFGELNFIGASARVTLAQHGPDEYTYGYFRYEDGELSVGYRTTDDDVVDAHDRVPDEARAHSLKPLANCPREWLEPLLEERTLGSLLKNIGDRLDEQERRLDGSLSALRAIVASESAQLDGQMEASLQTMDNDTLKRLWGEALDATHLHTADGLTRSSSFLESVCAAILLEHRVELPRDKSMAPLFDTCIRCLDWPEKKALADAKQVFAGLKSISGGIGTLRSHFSTAHGASSHLHPLDPSYATLAKNAAATVAIFLLARHTASRLSGAPAA